MKTVNVTKIKEKEERKKLTHKATKMKQTFGHSVCVEMKSFGIKPEESLLHSVFYLMFF